MEGLRCDQAHCVLFAASISSFPLARLENDKAALFNGKGGAVGSQISGAGDSLNVG